MHVNAHRRRRLAARNRQMEETSARMSTLPALPKSIATVSLSGTLPEKLEAAASIGFDGVEIFENDLLTYDGSPADVRAIADGLGLTITIFQPFRDFEAMPEPQRRAEYGSRRTQVRRHAGARHRPAAGVQQHPSRRDRRSANAPPPTSRKWQSERIVVACASATRHWPGAGTSSDGGRPGISSKPPTTPR